MSAALHLAGPADTARLAPLVASFHDETGTPLPDDPEAALAPLLDGSPHGCVYLIGPRAAPIGYLAVAFTWSLDHGGLVARIEHLFIRKGVRGRGVGTEVMASLMPRLEAAGICAISVTTPGANTMLDRLLARAGFVASDTRRAHIRRAAPDR